MYSHSKGLSLSNDKQSDFYINDDESDAYSDVPLPPPNNIKNDLFLYSPPNNSFALTNSAVYKENTMDTYANVNTNHFETESTIFLDTNQPSSNHLLFNNDLLTDQATNSASANGSNKAGDSASSKKAIAKNIALKKFNHHHIRHPPVLKKALRNSNSDLSIDEIQANLPSVLIINSNVSAVSLKTKIDENTTAATSTLTNVINLNGPKPVLKKIEKQQDIN